MLALGLVLAAGPAQAMSSQPESVEDVVAFALEDPAGVDAFWASTFAAWDETYVPLDVYYYDSEAGSGENYLTPCAFTREMPDNAFYCPVDHSIYLDRAYLRELYQEHGDYAVASTVAHEYGHAVDEMLHGETEPGPSSEYYADCLAGLYARSAWDAGEIDEADLEEAAHDYRSEVASESHGDPELRVEWFLTGFESFSDASCSAVLDA